MFFMSTWYSSAVYRKYVGLFWVVICFDGKMIVYSCFTSDQVLECWKTHAWISVLILYPYLSAGPCLKQGSWTSEIQGSLPTQEVLWFCDSLCFLSFFFFLFNWCCICFLATCSNLKALQNSLAVLVSVIAVDKIKPLLSRACVWIMMLAPKVFWRPCRPHFRYNSNEDIEWLVWQ